MVNVSAYPVTIDGRRLDDLAVGLESSALTLGGLRSGDQPLAGLDGEVGSLNDSREPSAFTLSALVRGTDADGFVPAGVDGQATYQRNLEGLKHLVAKTGALLDVARVTDKANSAILGTGGQVNLARNPTLRQTYVPTEYRRNYCTNPNFESGAATGWGNYVGVTPASVVAKAGAGFNGAYGGSATADGVNATIPRVIFQIPSAGSPFAPGDWVTATTRIRMIGGTGWAVNAVPYALVRGTESGATEWLGSLPVTLAGPDANGWYQIAATGQLSATALGQVVVNIGINNQGVLPPATAEFQWDEVLLEKAGAPLGYFAGDTAASAEGLTYEWLGTPHLSASRVMAPSLLVPGPFGSYSSASYVASARVLVGTDPRIRLLLKRAEPNGTLIAFTNSTGNDNTYTLVTPGETVASNIEARVAAGASVTLTPRVGFYTSAGANAGTKLGDAVTIPADGSWVTLPVPASATPANGYSARWLYYLTAVAPAGVTLEFRRPLMVKGLALQALPPSPYDPEGAGTGWVSTPEGAAGRVRGDADVRATCKVVDALTPEDVPGDYGRLTVALKVLGSYWRSVQSLWWQQAAVVSDTAYEITPLETSSAPVDDAVVCLTGPASAGVQLVDVATGNAVRLNEALPAGQVWRVNVGTWESRVGAGLTPESADTAGTDKAAVTDQIGTYPRLLRLNPRDVGGGRRVVRIKAVGAGFTAATTLDVKARRAHL